MEQSLLEAEGGGGRGQAGAECSLGAFYTILSRLINYNLHSGHWRLETKIYRAKFCVFFRFFLNWDLPPRSLPASLLYAGALSRLHVARDGGPSVTIPPACSHNPEGAQNPQSPLWCGSTG